ncbi:hypothetical protein P3T36_000274 [Kitasatospora sp. MAP12-15]|uniref:DUF6879 family protein n=1 Tax=unclassified Kitasatospora TaxID=2633591 RepID=UPI0024740D25|nr:DUF6879 family protein [Kitasatospora sp. MAP12-44]MDH6109503.1 hypothetical protein [Kitasatospora sp. MAP12-44]
MPDLLPAGPALSRLFEEFEHTAWRLESQPSYEADERTETYAQWLRGESWPDESDDPWYAQRRALIDTGRRIERVRLVSQPATDGERYLLARAPLTLAVGEDIRYLWRPNAERLSLPRIDVWIFDSRFGALFHYDGSRQLGIELIEDPARVLGFCQVRDAAWHHAIPHAEFTRAVPSTM